MSSPDAGTISVPMMDFQRQYREIRDEVLGAIERVCDSQRFVLGPEVKAFEEAAARLCGAGYGIGCSSGTDALWLALAAAEIGPGQAVITTPFSFFATVSSILRSGARPLLADIDPATFNLSAESVRQAIARHLAASGTEELSAILPVHLYGQCADWDAFSALAMEYDLPLIEDAAQAFGATWKGRTAGSLGELACFSFYPTKNLSAFGEAGLVTTSDAALGERCGMLRVHGMRQRYYHDEVGWNTRLDTVQAAVLLVKLAHVERWTRERQARAAEYERLFRAAGVVDGGPYPEAGVVLPAVAPQAGHVFHQYVIRVRKRDELRSFLTERRIGSEIYYPAPLHLQKCLLELGYEEGSLPESERAAREVLALPMFPELTQEEQERVVSAIAEFLSGGG